MKDLHGGNIYRFERKGKEVLDFSSNINPLGVPQKFIDIAKENFDKLTNYPDPYYIELREKIGEHNSVTKENIIVGNGATEILFLYMRAVKPKKVLVLAPCFAEYERALKSAGAQIEYFELKEKNNFYPDIQTLKKKLEGQHYDLFLFCNPNNPTGQLIKFDDVKDLAAICKKQDMKIFIDEAFIEFVENWKEKTAALLKNKDVFIMRAFTKFFAIPGLRLGYGISFDEELMNKLQAEKEPWSVNTFANLAGLVMLDDKDYIEKSEKWVAEEKNFLYQELSKNKNLKVYRSECNFLLIKLLTTTSQEIQTKLLEKNILVRDASNFQFLDESYIRVAVKDREKNLKLIESLG